jgi:two-component sensor histidine kinase
MLMPDTHARAHDGYIGAYKSTNNAKIIGIGREVEGRRKNASTFPLDLSIAEWRDAKGSRFFTGIMRDISDRKAAEAAQEALLYEVNHRTKNNLQLVSSLLAVQAIQSKDPEVKRGLADARARIEVVASIHRSLYQTATHNQVEICGYIRSLGASALASLEHGGRIGFELDCGKEIVLPLTQAVPLALIVNELVTNAVKYAWDTDETGTIGVLVEERDGGLRVEITDNGRGLPEDFNLARSTGVGMRIVSALVKQLRAKFEVVPQNKGAAFSIILPLR